MKKGLIKAGRKGRIEKKEGKNLRNYEKEGRKGRMKGNECRKEGIKVYRDIERLKERWKEDI